MIENREFAAAWLAWRREIPPISRFRTGQRAAPTYDLECALDHVVSSVYALGSAFMGGEAWDFAALATARLAQLEEIATIVPTIGAIAEQSPEFDRYIESTRRVLHALQ